MRLTTLPDSSLGARLARSALRVALTTAVLCTPLGGLCSAHANTTVTTTADSGPGSLRDAVAGAPPGDTIDFAGPVTGTITLTSGALFITESLTIAGPGAAILAISGNHASGVFDIDDAVTTIAISGLTIKDGVADNGAGINIHKTPGGSVTDCIFSGNFANNSRGGAIASQSIANLTITGCTFDNNRAAIFGGGVSVVNGTLTNDTFTNNAAAAGGGVGGDPTGDLTVSGCTFRDNVATKAGGGMFADEPGMLVLSDSTFDGNLAGVAGGGLYRDFAFSISNCTFLRNRAGRVTASPAGGGLFFEAGATGVITNSTIVGNRVPAGTPGGGIGIDGNLPVSVQNSIVAGNTPNDCSGVTNSGGHNIDGGISCGFSGTGDLSSTNPLLGEFGLHGGSVETFPLLPGSPAIDGGDPGVPGSGGTTCAAGDARGFARPGLVACDVGAYESFCGDTVVDLGEQCDLGDFVDGDGCDSNCTLTACGNSIVTAGEQCDDGNTANGDCCSSTCQFDAVTTSCADVESPCTAADQCNGSGACVSGPLAGCAQPVVADKASVLIKYDTDPGKNQIKWKWLKGEEMMKPDYGTPLATTGYLLCIYDATGVVSDATIPAAGTCGVDNPKACWKDVTTSFVYSDKDRTPDGVKKAKFKAGLDGLASVSTKSKGSLVQMPLPGTLESPLTVQLRRSDAPTQCWENVFSFPPARKHIGTQFKDKSDPPH